MFSKKEIFSIPNLISYIRLLLIPAFAYVYLVIETGSTHYFTVLLLIVCSLTDYLDGRIARKYQMVTQLGKLIDPVADKLYQLILAIILSFNYQYMKAVCILIIAENSILFFYGGYIYLKYHMFINGAKLPGKIATAVFFVFTIILTLWDLSSSVISLIMIIVMAMTLLNALIFYTLDLHKMHKQELKAYE